MENNIINLQTENYKLKEQINKFKQVCGLVSYIEDSTLKGGYRIVSSIQERDAIDMCHRKIGMIVSVRITETEYKNYRLISKDNWAEVISDGTPSELLETFPYTITDLTIGEKTITHNLTTETYLITFQDKITKEFVEIDNSPFDINSIKVKNDIELENQIDVLIIKVN